MAKKKLLLSMLKTMLLNNLAETVILFRIPGLIESKMNRKKHYLNEIQIYYSSILLFTQFIKVLIYFYHTINQCLYTGINIT